MTEWLALILFFGGIAAFMVWTEYGQATRNLRIVKLAWGYLLWDDDEIERVRTEYLRDPGARGDELLALRMASDRRAELLGRHTADAIE